MNKNEEFLNCIYKNADMGIIGIKNVINKVHNDEFERLLKKQKKEYNDICKEAMKLLKNYNTKPDNIGVIARVSTKVMADMNLLNDDSTEKIAKLMMEGTNKGIVEIVDKINAYNDIDKDIINLAKKFKSILEKNIDELKKYI
jgi:hypothetical protein